MISENSLYNKRQIEGKNVDTINQHLADRLESHAGKDYPQVCAESVELFIYPKAVEDNIRHCDEIVTVLGDAGVTPKIQKVSVLQLSLIHI